MAEEGEKRAKTLEKLVERPAKLLSTLLVANNAVNITATTIGTALSLPFWVLSAVYGSLRRRHHPGFTALRRNNAENPGDTIPGENRHARQPAHCFPGNRPLPGGQNLLPRCPEHCCALSVEVTVGHDPTSLNKNCAQSSMSASSKAFWKEERAMIIRSLNLAIRKYARNAPPHRHIRDPRHCSISEILPSVVAEGFSRIPVYEETIDNIVGIVYAKDLLRLCVEKKTDTPIQELLRHAYYVPESKKVNELFRELQKERVHMAVVLDEFGGTAGIVTIEDLMEEIFGEIEDEYDQEDKFLLLTDTLLLRPVSRSKKSTPS